MPIRTLLVACSVAVLAAATANAATFKVIHEAKFNRNSGLFVTGALFEQPVLSANGVLFGAGNDGGGNITNGGTQEFGVLYSLTPPAAGKKTWPYKVIHTFRYNKNEAMAFPAGPLTPDGAGGFYGTTQKGVTGPEQLGGAIFHLVPTANAYKLVTLHQFNVVEGVTPSDGVIADAAGNLYGTTTALGPGSGGTVFKLTPPTPGLKNWTLTTLHSFAATNALGQPRGELLRDASGNLFGVTQFDGASHAGTVYQLSPQADGSYSYSVLYNFTGGADGGTPSGGLLVDAAGNFYGTASAGGADGQGTVFKLTPGAGGFTEEALYSFLGGGSGAEPNGGVVMDEAGNLFGMTRVGGFPNPGTSNTYGTIFELSPAAGGGWTFNLLHAFAPDSSEGAHPTTRLVRDGAGNLFGASYDGGTDSSGMIFEVAP